MSQNINDKIRLNEACPSTSNNKKKFHKSINHFRNTFLVIRICNTQNLTLRVVFIPMLKFFFHRCKKSIKFFSISAKLFSLNIIFPLVLFLFRKKSQSEEESFVLIYRYIWIIPLVFYVSQ